MKRAFILILILLLLFCSGCAQTDDGSAAFAPDDAHRLVVYTSHKEDVYLPIIKEFQDRTGIWVIVKTGGTNELLEQIAGEARAPLCDVMFGGGIESLESYQNYFEAYTSPEINSVMSAYRSQSQKWTPFSSLPVVLIYNTKLVPEGAVTGWDDLLDPKWKGSIAFADPEASGSSYTMLVTMMQVMAGQGWESLEVFADNLDNQMCQSSGEAVSAVENGVCALGLTLEETAVKRIRSGSDIAMVYPKEGTSSVPDGTALVAGAPHADNARLFIDFVMSGDIQQMLVSELFRRSVRTDVLQPQELPARGELSLIKYDLSWASSNKSSILQQWALLFD